jgi:hypothetical protein
MSMPIGSVLVRPLQKSFKDFRWTRSAALIVLECGSLLLRFSARLASRAVAATHFDPSGSKRRQAAALQNSLRLLTVVYVPPSLFWDLWDGSQKRLGVGMLRCL